MSGRRKRAVKIEYEAESNNEETAVAVNNQDLKNGKSTGKSSKKTNNPKSTLTAESKDASVDPIGDESKKKRWEPENWTSVLKNIKEMRSQKGAPVDTMGCERTMEENVELKVRRFQTLLSLMLSSRTKDPVTYAAMERLKAGQQLTVQKFLDMSEKELGETIIPVGFWKTKAQYIKKTVQILRDKYDDDIPDTIEGLCSLAGVGPKMAYIAMNVAWEKNAGIGVDVHVHRIANRLKWTGPKETKAPEETRVKLESWLPPEEWQEINILLVGFGQTICLPINPKCADCTCNQLCPYGRKQLRGVTMKKNKGSSSNNVDKDDGTDDDETSKYF